MKLSSKEQRFWVLFSEYERLVDSEAFALKEHNFDYVQKILEKKAAVLQALNILEQQIDCGREDEHDYQQRLDHLQKNQQRNAAALKVLMDEVQQQLKSNQIAQRRVNRLQKNTPFRPSADGSSQSFLA